ncbi:MAG TPA: hypothetical protein DCY48_04760 [Candidatus Magasanikbacteria bacterium]|nr:MAG: hypothetical protein A3I74_03240 [Candidatus Magasanikbacteria bacterium RIFCSPLOWO2_02_FULL_47_16]OGH80225.1 MAG: hypothetical protein A3C10_03520 [Candidatus Magasanikbacteria bacterium RIFCSPHIGHO2_02_FULL_48_18]OGH82718.1 MAG: hypothetical protein A3G08_01535 [Candidatus Magasanikbacteria bacterium RIFCSPLOWO2_12_FULL_47_9b]HAZ29052.1 hypothetical protein [Candidatus Magasanikbacteria bacterium]
MDKKRIIFAILFIIVTILLGYLMYRVFFAKKTPKPPTPQTQEQLPGGQFPIIGEGGQPGQIVTGTIQLPTAGFVPPQTPALPPPPAQTPLVQKLANDIVVSPAADSFGGAKFYNAQDGKFYRLLPDGTLALLSDDVFFGVENVSWSPKTEEAIIEYPDGANIYFDFETKKQVTLPKHWENFSFSPTATKIAAKSIGLSPETRWLITADPQGNNITLVEPMGQNADKVDVNWSPNQQIVATSLTGKPMGGNREQVLMIGLHGEVFKAIIAEGQFLDSAWSKTGEKLLFSSYSTASDYKPELWISNAAGDLIGTGRKPLGLNTWAEKCTFADDRFVYCAVPKTLPTGSGFEQSLADAIEDDLYKIDTQTGIKSKLLLEEGHVIDTILVNGDTDALYFTDKNQKGIFTIAL